MDVIYKKKGPNGRVYLEEHEYKEPSIVRGRRMYRDGMFIKDYASPTNTKPVTWADLTKLSQMRSPEWRAAERAYMALSA